MFFSVTKLFQNKDVNLRRMVRCNACVLASSNHRNAMGSPGPEE